MAILFDTHRAIQNLKEAGVAESQAEAMVAMVGGLVGDNVATKADVQRVEERIESESRQHRTELNALEQRIESESRQHRTELNALEQRITLRLTVIGFAGLGLLFAALKFIP